jgi:hypothetical protein
MGRHGRGRLAVIGSAAVCACVVSAAPAVPPTAIEALMTDVGERVADYCRRAQRVVCVERSTVQPIDWSWAPQGFSRTVESERRVDSAAGEGETLPEAKVVRDIRLINGRAPRVRDQKDRAGCTDPTPVSPEPLTFLLHAHRAEYRFTSVRPARERDRAALIIEFMSLNRTSRPVLVEDERGHDDCFDWSGPIATKGRVWVDASTHDALRVERRIDGPVDVQVPWRLQRRYHLAAWVVLERDDLIARYKTVAFSDPDEVMLLPESTESLTIVRAGLQSIRQTETFSECRRFLTRGRIVKDP